MNVVLCMYWRKRQVSLDEFIKSVRIYLQDLQAIHPIFKDLYEVGNKPNDEMAILSDLSNLVEVCRNRAYDKDYTYSKIMPDGKPAPEAICSNGYYIILNNKKTPKEGKIVTSIYAGGETMGRPNSVTIEFPEYRFPEFSKRELVLRLINAVVDRWSPDYGLVTEKNFRDITYDNWDSLTIGWMTYSSNPTVCHLLPSDIQCERLGPGSLITISEEVSTTDNPDHVEKALTISNCLAGKVTRR